MELDDRDLEGSLDDLFDNAPCGYLTTNADGLIVKVNETFLSLAGLVREGLVGVKRFRDLLTVPGRIYYETHVAPLLQMQSFVREVAFDIARPGSTALPVLVNLVQKLRSDASTAVIRIIVFVASDRRTYEQEILIARRTAEQAAQTERLAREESERANRAKDEFLALVSHELRTPLGAILGWTQILKKRNAGNVELSHGLEVIERNTRLQVLVDDLLDMSRIVAGKVRLDVQRVNLAAMVEASIETARPAAQARELTLRTILDPSIFVAGDPGRLQQVFWNLLSNAIKFTPKGGSVRLVMERVNSHIEVSVIDSGQGMSADLIGHVFERFRQSVSPATQQTGGLGLGLSIVKSIVEMHGGSVTAHSEGEGRGSQFIISLPVVIAHSDDETKSHPQAVFSTDGSQPERIDLRGVKVLLVDDDADARDVMVRVISGCAAEVTAVASASEALKAIALLRPDVLISDIGLPGEDGYELIRKIRMLGEGGDTAAIALTALSRLEDRTQALLAGFQIHLKKPVDTRELLITIASLAGRIRSRAEA
jgi:signal transduction histidine kinase/CheY-like chemotaxis protein